MGKAIDFLNELTEIERQRDLKIRDIGIEFDELCDEHGNLIIAEAHQMRGDHPLTLNDIRPRSHDVDAILQLMSIAEVLLATKPKYYNK